MAEIKDLMAATCEYTHKKAGKVISTGKTKVDWLGRIHSIQKFSDGRVVESIFMPSGKLIKTINKTPLFVKLLRVVGIRRK